MDEVAAGAVTAVWHADAETAGRWFALIGQEYRRLAGAGDQHDWPAFKVRLAERAGRESFAADAAEALTRYLDDHSPAPMDVIRWLAESDAVDMYVLAVENGPASPSTTPPGQPDRPDG